MRKENSKIFFEKSMSEKSKIHEKLAEKNCQKMHCIPRYLQNFFKKIFFEKSMSEKWKIYEKLVTHFVEFIGFMVCKTTGSISPLFLLKKIAKKCLVFRDFYTSLIIFLHLFCKYLWIQGIFSQFFSARMTVRSSRSFCIP